MFVHPIIHIEPVDREITTLINLLFGSNLFFGIDNFCVYPIRKEENSYLDTRVYE